MTGTFVSLIFAFLLATGFACLFHLFVGGRAGRILLYIVMSNIGFAIGHLFGQGMGVTMMKLGPLYLLSATLGAVLFLVGARWLWPESAEDSSAP